MTYDIIIAGAGPAGTTAAYKLNKYGYDILLLDKNKFPRSKLCAGLLTIKTIDLTENVFGITLDELGENNIIDYSSDFYKIFYKDKLVYESYMEDEFFYVKRENYDSYLMEKLKKTEVNVKEETAVKKVDLKNNIVFTENDEKYTADYIIGADGANSIIRRKLLIESNRPEAKDFRENMAATIEAVVPREKFEYDLDHPQLYYGILDWGYGWVFPRQDSLVIGIAGHNYKNDNFAEIFHDYLKLLHIDDEIDYSGWQLPYGNYLKNPIYRKTVLIGDAAGLVEPFTGEGIYYAQKSGQMAANAIHKAVSGDVEIAKVYPDLLQKGLLRRLKKFKRMSNLFYSSPQFMHKYLIKFVTKFMGGYITGLIQGK